MTKGLRKAASMLIVMMICLGTVMPALAADHNHNDYIHTWQYHGKDENNHVKYGYCSYMIDSTVGSCDYLVETNEPHTYVFESVSKDLKTYKASCSTPGCGYSRSFEVNEKSWMATIPDSALISQINLPGSFVSGTKYSYSDNAKEHTQKESIPDQLDFGVRILHAQLNDDSDYNWYNYRATYDGYNLSTGKKSGLHWEELWFVDIAKYISAFLKENPSEAIVMLVQSDSKRSNVKKKLMQALDYEREHGDDLWSIFDAYRPDDPIPTLGEVRGKCVVLCLDEDSYTDYASVYELNNVVGENKKGYDALSYTCFTMHPYFSQCQDYTRTKDTFKKESYRFITNPGEPSVKIVGYDVDLNMNHSENRIRKIVYDNKYDWYSATIAYVLLQPLIEGFDYENMRGHRIGWVISIYTTASLTKAVIQSNARVGDEIKPFDEDTSTDPVDYGLPMTDWMAYMPDNVQISQLNLPGTHDSATRYMYSAAVSIWGRCQSKTIRGQMDAGIRCFDIRLGELVEKDGPWWKMELTHGGYDCYIDDKHTRRITLEDALLYAKDFLKEHQSETLVYIVSEEDDKPAAIKRIREMKKVTDHRIKNRTDRFNFVDFYSPGEVVPKLGDVRGRLVVIWDNNNDPGVDGIVQNSYDSYENEYDVSAKRKINYIRMASKDQYLVYMQHYKTSNDKFSSHGIKNVRNPGNPDVKYWNYNSNNPGDQGPEGIFDAMSEELEKIVYRRGKRVGWVAMDFPYFSMINGIIRSNDIFNLFYEANVHIPEEYAEAVHAFSMATLVDWKDDGTGEGHVISTIDMSDDIQSILDDNFTAKLDFRAYDIDPTDSDKHYAIVFPDGTEYEITREVVLDEVVKPGVVNGSGKPFVTKATGSDNERNIRHIKENIEIVGRIKPPKTGDDSHPVQWIVLMGIAAAGLAALTVWKKKEKRMH